MSEFRKSLTAIAVTAGSLAAAIGASSAAQADTAHGASAMASSVAPLPKPGLPPVSNGPIYAQTTGRFGPVSGGGATMTCNPLPHLVAWSPDGSRLACLEPTNSGMLRIWSPDGAIPVAGSVNGYQNTGPSTNISSLTWFNHGTEIVLAQNGNLFSTRADGTLRSADRGFALTPLLPTVTGVGLLSSDASGNLLVFTQNVVSATNVVLYDRTKPAGSALQTLTQLTNAATPALSPDGRYIAYTVYGPQGSSTAAQIWLYDLQSPASASNPRQLTADTTTNHIEPHWSPDGTRIAYQASTVGQPSISIASIAVANPSAQNTEIPNSPTGTYAWRPLTTKPVERLAGTDRIGTSVAVSQAAWESAGASNTGRRTAKSVTLSRSDLFADALGGAGFAAHQQGPLLLTEPGKLNPATLAELQRVLGPGTGGTGPTVYLLGGESALSPAVKNALVALNYNVVRLGGLNRFQTAVTIAKQDCGTTPNKVLVATGRNYPDALAAGAAAGANPNTVVVLTDDGTMPPETAAYLNGLSGATIYGVGGQAVTALAGRTAIPLKGVDRIDTSLLVARNLFDTPQSVGFATSTNWPDSLAGGALQGTVGGPLLLVAPSGLSPDEMTYIVDAASSVESAQIYGGSAAVPAIENRVGTEIGGSAGFVVK